jgi:hypothetical protein
MADLRPPLDLFFGGDLGSPATVTPVGSAAVETRIVWMSTPNQVDAAAGVVSVDHPPRLRVRRDEVPTLPPGSLIQVAPPGGGDPLVYTVDRVEFRDEEMHQVVVS